MKKILFSLFVTLSTLCGYSQDTKQLVISTLSGKLSESQFKKNGYYFITVDTVLEKNIVKEGHPLYTSEYHEYNSKIKTTDDINKLMKYFGFDGYYNLIEIKESRTGIFGLSKKHVSTLTNKGDYTYLIRWFFSEGEDYTKLWGISISKISKKES